MSDPVLDIRGLSVRFGSRQAVDRLDLAVAPGERVALVGESGSGKTVTALSILHLVREAAITGSIRVEGREVLGMDDRALHALRGGRAAMIFQEPMTALNPVLTIGTQIAEVLVQHEGIAWTRARDEAVRLLARTGVREPGRRVDSHPHELSGGQRQRAMIAMALACRPRLLIADEPTTALDVTVRARIVRLLLDLQAEEAARGDGGMAILLITHDLHLVRRFAERVAVMENGRLVEQADTATLFADPRHPYTRRLLASLPERRVDPIPADAPVLLATEGLGVDYPRRAEGWRGWFRSVPFRALDGATVTLRAGETVGVVGESGSGKSTLAQAVLDLIPSARGRITIDGRTLAERRGTERRALRGRLQVVFQDPYGALSPRQTIAQIVGEGLEIHRPELPPEARRRKVVEALAEVGLPATALEAYPHQFSGGQRQRIAIARALVVEPRIVILDEPTSALDVSIQKQVLDLLAELQRRHGFSYLLITHDLAVVRALAHRVYVLRDGAVVEEGETLQVLDDPRHEYTRSLVEAAR
jgi:microcin C transport system ATP-binding protein